jgi:hypothetical protein
MDKYSITYKGYTWVVVDNNTGKGICCFPSQIQASNWIANQLSK